MNAYMCIVFHLIINQICCGTKHEGRRYFMMFRFGSSFRRLAIQHGRCAIAIHKHINSLTQHNTTHTLHHTIVCIHNKAFVYAIRSYFFVLTFVHNCFPTHMDVYSSFSLANVCTFCILIHRSACFIVCGLKSWASDNHCTIHSIAYRTSQVETTCVYSLTCYTHGSVIDSMSTLLLLKRSFTFFFF